MSREVGTSIAILKGIEDDAYKAQKSNESEFLESPSLLYSIVLND